MRRSRRLEPISQVVNSAERLAARALTACQRRVAAQEARLAELRAFRTEYQQRFQEAGRAGMNARQLQDFCEFLTRLDTTAEHQSQLLLKLREELDDKKQQWMHSRVKTKILDKVVTRHRQEERRQEDSREQGESDDRSQHTREKQDLPDP